MNILDWILVGAGLVTVGFVFLVLFVLWVEKNIVAMDGHRGDDREWRRRP
jgi:hypothetical protein